MEVLLEHSTAKELVGIPKSKNSEATLSLTRQFLVQCMLMKSNGKKMGSAEEYQVYLSLAEELLLKTPKSAAMKITLPASSFELFSFVPITKLNHTTKFAPIGLTNMF